VNRTLYAVFLYGVNIPGGRWFTSAAVESGLQPLRPAVAFAATVGRPDSLLVWSNDGMAEDSVRRAVTEALDCACVALSITALERITAAALAALRASGDACTPPYRVTADGTECEWCLVFASDALPPGAIGDEWLFKPTRNTVAMAIVERRALLARKRRLTPRGKRVMLGAALNDPWQRTLDHNGVTVACLTSRTLNRVAEVFAAAKSLVPGDTVGQ
jgi:hypothetical protein